MVFQAVLAFTLLISATVEAGGGVSIWMDHVTLTCPAQGSWFHRKGSDVKSVGQNGSATHEYKFDGSKDQYICKFDEVIYHFYIQGKACEHCIELEAWVFAVVIVADVIGTTVVMAIVYKCAKRSSGGPQKSSKAARSREMDIPLNTRTYEPLNVNTMSQDPYSSISVINRTG